MGHNEHFDVYMYINFPYDTQTEPVCLVWISEQSESQMLALLEQKIKFENQIFTNEEQIID
jgi:hypothetical protein